MLNIGLEAGILDTQTFSMFVVHSVVLTFITTPLTLLFYPAKYRNLHHGGESAAEHGSGNEATSDDEAKTRFALVLEKIEQLPAAMTISQLLQSDKTVTSYTRDSTSTDEKGHVTSSPTTISPVIKINALRLIELTNRTSAVLKSQLASAMALSDPVVSVFRTFGHLNRLAVSAALSVVAHDEFISAINSHVEDTKSHVVILPWSWSVSSGEGDSGHSGNPFDAVFHKSAIQDQSSAVYSEFVRKVFASSPIHVALFIDRGPHISSYLGPSGQHLFLPFFGGPDDRLALSFVVQLCQKSTVQATIIRIQKLDDLSRSSSIEDGKGGDFEVAPSTPISVPIPQVH